MKKLIDAGASEYKIVIPASPNEAEKFAAQELQHFIAEASRVVLPLITDLECEEGEDLISVGKTSLLPEDIVPSSKELNYDGFILRTVGNMLFLAAQNERGVIYAAYELLERIVGLHFLARDDYYLLQTDQVCLPDFDVKQVPSFAIRSCFACPAIEDAEFAVRTRTFCPYGKNEAKYGFGYLHEWYNNELHSFMDLVPLQKHYDKHPEWFSKKDERAWLCLTNGLTDDGKLDETMKESVVSEVIKRLKERIRERPEVKYFMVGQEDSFSECTCERCTKALERNKNLTGNLLVFINCIAREIGKWVSEEYPGREVYIVTFSYQKTLMPPVKTEGGQVVPVHDGVVPEKNVFIFYAASSLCYMHAIGDKNCTWNTDIERQLIGWKALTDRFMVWDYGTNFTDFLWYFPDLRQIKNNLIRYKQNGAILVLHQTAPREWRFYDMQLKYYVASRLMWDTERDTFALVEEFNRLYFGEEIGKDIDEYIRIMENHFDLLDRKYRGTFHSDLYANFEHTFAPENFPADVLRRAETKILNAIDKAEKASGLTREERAKLIWKLKTVLIQPQNMILKNYEFYYGDAGKKEYALAFFKNLNETGLWYYGESFNKTRDELKMKLGV